MAFTGDYTLLRKIPIDATAVSGSNDDFTGLITEAAFKLSKTFIFANTDNGGGDVRISTDEAGLNQIPIDLVSWDTSGETCELHYLADGVDDVSPADLYIWGDNTGDSQPSSSSTFGSESVWVNYEYVSHDGITDSTGNHTITQFGSPTVGVNDWGGDSVVLNGSSQYGRVTGTFITGIPVYMSSWYKLDSISISGNILGAFKSGVGDVFDTIRHVNDKLQMWRRNSNASTTSATQSSSSTALNWEKCSGYVNSSGDRVVYLDGASKTTNSTAITQTTGTFDRVTYGRADDSTPGNYLDGELSELRLAYFSPNDDLELTEYSNQSDIAGFYLEPEVVSGGISITSLLNSNYMVEYSMKKNTAGQSIGAQMVTISDGSDFTGTVTAEVTIDNGTKTAGGGSVTHEGEGYHSYAPTQAETNGDHIAVSFAGTGALSQTIQVYTTFPQSVDNDAKISLIPTTAMRGTDSANTVVPPSVAQFNARTILSADYFNPSTDAVENVTLVATTTTNSDMRGTDSANTIAPDNASITLILADTNDLQTNQGDWLTATGFSTSAEISALNDLSFSDIWTGTLTESYAADGAAITPAQGMHMIWSDLRSPQQLSTTWTDFRLNNTTASMTFTLDDATTPTKKTRAT